MKIMIKSPHKIIWTTALILLLFSLFHLNNTIDIQLHDTYMVFTILLLLPYLSLILVTTGLLYWLMRYKKLISWMTIVHVVTTVSLFSILLISGIALEGGFTFGTAMSSQFLVLSLFLILISYLIFLLNLVISLFKNVPVGHS